MLRVEAAEGAAIELNRSTDGDTAIDLHILVYLVIYDSGWVSLEHLLLSRHLSLSLSTLRFLVFVCSHVVELL